VVDLIVLAEAQADHLKEYLKQSGPFLFVCFEIIPFDF
jgi:hypothetical protein